MDLIQAITLQTLQFNFAFTATHIPCLDNSIADSLSRFQMDRFCTLAPSASPTTILEGQYSNTFMLPLPLPLAIPVKHFLTFTLMHGLVVPSNPSLRIYPDVFCISLSQHSVL